jgi:hypothetical protein
MKRMENILWKDQRNNTVVLLLLFPGVCTCQKNKTCVKKSSVELGPQGHETPQQRKLLNCRKLYRSRVVWVALHDLVCGKTMRCCRDNSSEARSTKTTQRRKGKPRGGVSQKHLGHVSASQQKPCTRVQKQRGVLPTAVRLDAKNNVGYCPLR